VAGWTDSNNLPVYNSVQPAFGGSVDAFVAKFDPTGSTLIYCTYLGGSGDDRAFGLAVDAAGNAYITGWTYSTNFPSTASAAQLHIGGYRDAFVAKLSPAGTQLLYSSYLGGSDSDVGRAIAVDASGNLYVAGETASPDFPVLNPFQGKLKGAQNAFLSSFDPLGKLRYSTILGGAGTDSATGVAVDGSGNAYVTGGTTSSDFPVTANVIQSSIRGHQNAFVTAVGSTGKFLLYSTYLGGSGATVIYAETGFGIDVDSSGSAYVTGVTSSGDFPVQNAIQSTLHGSQDAFVVKLNSTGTGLLFSSFFGGSGLDVGTAIHLTNGAPCIAGYTASSDFPVVDPVQRGLAGSYDAFLSCFSPTGANLTFSTFWGGANSDAANALAVGPRGAFLAGQTQSRDLPLVSAYQATSSGPQDGLLVAIAHVPPPIPSVPAFPFPSNGSIDVALNSTLAWNSTDATSYVVYLGVTPQPLLLATIAASNYDPGFLSPATTYYWQVSARSPAGSATSSLWSFTTMACVYDLSVPTATASSSGGTGGLTVNAPVGCMWSASSDSSWLTITSGSSGRGGGTVAYSVAANSSSAARIGTITVGGLKFQLSQAAPPLFVISANPTSGGGASVTFALTVSDGKGAGSIVSATLLLNSSLTGTGGCFVSYSQRNNSLYLANDGVSAWLGPSVVGGGAVLSNSQCTVNPAAASVTLAGSALTLSIPMTFAAAFAGAKTSWGYASDVSSANSGYQALGAWVVTTASTQSKIGIFNSTQSVFLLDANGNFAWDGTHADAYFSWGTANHNPKYIIVLGDWNGSGTKKAGIFDPGTATWLLDYNGDGVYTPGVDRFLQWGSPGDIPVVGDWNGSGTAKIGTFGPTTGVWLLDYNGNYTWDGPGSDRYFAWGSAGDTPVVGDWNGSGTTKVGTFGPNTGLWLLDYNGNFAWDGPSVDKYFPWGSGVDTPLVGDWSGSGTTKVGTFGPNTGLWLLDYNGNFTWDGPGTDKYFPWGSPGDTPVTGDWSGNGSAKVGTFGPGTALWLLDYNGNFTWDGPGVDKYFPWGSPGDKPVVSR
jgi:hypothetical protein